MATDYDALKEAIEAQVETAATAMSRTISTDSRSVTQPNPLDLIRAANNNGGTDNITVVLAQTFVDPLWVPSHGYPQQMPRY